MSTETVEPAECINAFNELLDRFAGRRGSDTNYRDHMGWHAVLQDRYEIHPSIRRMLELAAPENVRLLALEYPHVSEKDAQRIAYTRSVFDGENDRQLVTSIGKYLARHWPNVPDHVRRDVQAFYTPDNLVFGYTHKEIIVSIELGPRSCMASIYGSIPFDRRDHDTLVAWRLDSSKPEPRWDQHPYICYAPEHGWACAMRVTAAGSIDGRALLLNHNDKRVFVRTYRRNMKDPNGWSETDFALQGWLENQGYEKVDAWPEGAKLTTRPAPEGYGRNAIFAPYIDGGNRGVDWDGKNTLTIVKGGYSYYCENTSAYVGEYRGDDDYDADDYNTCEDCGTEMHRDETYYVGPYEDRCVCGNCEENYVLAYTDRGRRTIHIDDTAPVQERSFRVYTAYPPTYVRELYDGDWGHEDDVVRIDDEYYMATSSEIVMLEECAPNGDSYGLVIDCFQDPNGGYWKTEAQYLEHNPVEEEAAE